MGIVSCTAVRVYFINVSWKSCNVKLLRSVVISEEPG